MTQVRMDNRHPSQLGVSFSKDPIELETVLEGRTCLPSKQRERRRRTLIQMTRHHNLTPLQVVNTFHKPNLINKLMYVLVQVNGVVVRAMVDIGATECCLSSSIAATVGLTVEPYASVVIPLHGKDHRVDGMTRAVPFQMGDWTGHCDFMVMYLRDFELVLGMDFLIAAKVGILPYLGSLAFLEFGTPYVVKTMPMEEEPNFDLTRMVATLDLVGV